MPAVRSRSVAGVRCPPAASCSSSSKASSGAAPCRSFTGRRRRARARHSPLTAAELGYRMAVAFLDFEQPIAELEAKIEELKHVTSETEVNILDEIGRLQAKSRQLTMSIFANLPPRATTQP